MVYRAYMEKRVADPDEKRRFTIWLTNQLHYELRKAAFLEERNISDVARELIAAGLKRRKSQ